MGNSQKSKSKADAMDEREAGAEVETNVFNTVVAEREQPFKHVPLSFDRPAATNPQKLLDSMESVAETMRRYNGINFQKKRSIYFEENAKSKGSDVVEDRTLVIGSTDEIYSKSDTGFFETVLMAYNEHYNLRTSPEDWWYCVIRRVALAIDNNSSKDSVRKMFVEHQGKKTLTVTVPEWPLSSVNYDSFFEKMSEEIANNVKVPEYVDAMTANFSCTTNVQRIVSQITLMSSMQEFFEYRMRRFVCGIPAIEMLGTEADWEKLLAKIKALKSVLQPIMNDIRLTEQWWSLADEIFSKLLDTYRGKPDKKWWTHILTYNENFGYEVKNPDLPPDYSGWIVEFLEGRVGVDKYQFTSGLVTVPLKIVDDVKGVEDTAKLSAGMVGMTVHVETVNNRPSVQLFQGWALMLPPNSPLSL